MGVQSTGRSLGHHEHDFRHSFTSLDHELGVVRHTISNPFGDEGRTVQAGPIRLELDEARVFVDDSELSLTPIEFGILSLLVRSANKLVTRDAIIEAVWGMDPVSAESYLVKLHVQHLRAKLGELGVDRGFIVSVRGLGYKVTG